VLFSFEEKVRTLTIEDSAVAATAAGAISIRTEMGL
jgi:hypothetical protein